MENTKIEWATHTFNPWEGCAKVSAGCKHCYADAQHNLHHAALKTQSGTCWGVNAPRMGKSADNWKKPLRWNREAAAAGVRARVFCASMADVFEAQSELSRAFAGQTNEVPCGGGRTRTVTFVDIAAERLRLLRLIHDTPHLDWLLLTKRPENIVPAIAEALVSSFSLDYLSTADEQFYEWLFQWVRHNNPPANVWLGTSVENQEQANLRIPHLLAAPAAVRFLSCEPLLGSVDLTQIVRIKSDAPERGKPDISFNALKGWYGGADPDRTHIDWVIVGGESGHGARPMHPDWARGLRDQCQAAGVSFFFKQFGEWVPAADYSGVLYPRVNNRESVLIDGKLDGSHAMYTDPALKLVHVVKVGKHAAGRHLDGRTWDEVPQGKEVARG